MSEIIEVKSDFDQMVDDLEYIVGNNEMSSSRLFTEMKELIALQHKDHLKAIEELKAENEQLKSGLLECLDTVQKSTTNSRSVKTIVQELTK